MRALRQFFIILTLLVLSQSTFAQYEFIFKTPFSKQITLLDSVCISLAKVDSQTFYNEIAKLRTAAANTDDYTRLNLERTILSVKNDGGYERETAVLNGEKIIKEAMKMNAPEIAAVQYMALGFYYELKKQNLIHYAKGNKSRIMNTGTYVELTNSNPNEVTGTSKFTITVMPNPTSYYFTLVLKSLSKEKIKVTVTDITGRIIEQRTDIAANSTIQLAGNYHPGVYIAEFLQGNDGVAIRLIKEGK